MYFDVLKFVSKYHWKLMYIFNNNYLAMEKSLPIVAANIKKILNVCVQVKIIISFKFNYNGFSNFPIVGWNFLMNNIKYIEYLLLKKCYTFIVLVYKDDT